MLLINCLSFNRDLASRIYIFPGPTVRSGLITTLPIVFTNEIKLRNQTGKGRRPLKTRSLTRKSRFHDFFPFGRNSRQLALIYPIEASMAELGQETLDFAALVGRAAEESYVSLKELVEKSKSTALLSDSERKIMILKYIVKTQQRMLRLNVLAKWCQQVLFSSFFLLFAVLVCKIAP